MSEKEVKPAIPLPFDDPSEVPDFLREDNWYEVDISQDFLNFEKPYRPPRYTMKRNGVPFANVGELHIISGKPGNGKTGLMSQLMATLLCGRFGNTEYALSEERPQPRVLYIDTEQGEDDTIAVKNRVCTLAKLPYDQPLPQFSILCLRETEKAEVRWRKILKAIYVAKPTDIFLDGMLDIVKDYNDQEECQPVVRKCMMTATHYDASLWAVLHENPLVDKLVGTLGSIAQRKVAEIFTTIKVKQGDLKPKERRDDLPDIYFKVKQVKARGRDVDDWIFEYVTNAGGWGVPVELNTEPTETPEDAEQRKWKKECNDRLKNFAWSNKGVTYSDLDRHLASQGITSTRKKSNIINGAMELGILTATGIKGQRKYFYNGDRELPHDETQDLPFDKADSEEECPY